MRFLLLGMVLLAVVLWAADFAVGNQPGGDLFSVGGHRPLKIGRTPKGLTGTSGEACGHCHTEIMEEWRGSLHARAWTDPVFQDAFRDEPLAQCRNCHAPENAGRPPSGTAASDGVSCAVCHVRKGKVLATDKITSAPSPHPILETPSLGTSQFCAGCHQFNFLTRVGERGVETDEVQQDTFVEWQRSTAGREGKVCQDCHMPVVPNRGRPGTHRSHALPGGFDENFVRRAVGVVVRAEHDGARAVVLATFTPKATGHAFPTGDLFRRAELVVSVESDPARRATFSLARRFRDSLETLPGVPKQVYVRREVSDTRVPPPGTGRPAERRLWLDAKPGETLVWSFDYLLMPTPSAAGTGGEPIHRIQIDHGRMDVPMPAGHSPPDAPKPSEPPTGNLEENPQ